jgi:hypothetical protein
MPTKVNTISGSQLTVLIDDGAGNYTMPCVINTTRGIAFSSSPIENLVAFCDTPDEPGWMEREIDGLSAMVPGAGKLDISSLQVVEDWYFSGDSKNVQVWVGTTRHYDFAAVLSAFEVNGDRREKVNFTCTILSDGPVTRTLVP